MRIEDDDRSALQDTLRQIQEQEARRAAELDSANANPNQEGLQVDEAQRLAGENSAAEQVRALDSHTQVQSTEQTQDTQSGTERADDAVRTADSQQDRGETWRDFAARDETVIPPSVDDIKAQETRQDDARQQDQQLRVSDLLAQMKIQGGKIGA